MNKDTNNTKFSLHDIDFMNDNIRNNPIYESVLRPRSISEIRGLGYETRYYNRVTLGVKRKWLDEGQPEMLNPSGLPLSFTRPSSSSYM